ncbi:MAG: phosphatase PAP2 family protein [Candidatus Hodarchaeota archaeon]
MALLQHLVPQTFIQKTPNASLKAKPVEVFCSWYFFDPQVIILLQSLFPYWVWEILNLVGDQLIYVVLLGFAFWCLNKKEGKIALMLVMFSGFFNILAKYAFGMDRPPTSLRYNPDYAADQSNGFPSGATQLSTTFWGWATIRLRHWGLLLVSVMMIALTALARMGLGLHYLGDVLGGIIIAILILVWAYFMVPYIIEVWKKMPSYLQDWLLPGIALLLFVGFLVAYAMGVVYWPTENVAVSMGVIFGFGVGAVLETKYVNFTTDIPRNRKVFRGLVGILVALPAFYALDFAFDLLPMIPLLHFSFRFIKYLIIGFFGAFVIPVIFTYIEKRRELGTSASDKVE